MEYHPLRVSDIIRQINRDLYLPAIQREFVWSPKQIERLFDSIMADFPIGSFLWWLVKEENKGKWPVYKFIQNFDEESPHNPPANMHGITKDITLVLDGQQRITSLFVGLQGTYRYFHYRWRESSLYLNLLKSNPDEDNPEELTYGFEFREDTAPSNEDELWYKVGQILDFDDAEDAKHNMQSQLAGRHETQRIHANKLIGRLHNRIHTKTVGNYYQEKSQDYDKVVQVFIRANSAGKTLEYSDILLATATAQWRNVDARSEIHNFTDSLNELAQGGKFSKDFVLKACLYLSNLPIQYKIKNFTKDNLYTIEENWENIKNFLSTTVRLIRSSFNFDAKNIVAPLALLPIAFYIMKRGNLSFDTSSNDRDVEAKIAIRKWFIISTLKNAFGGSSDTKLAQLRVDLGSCDHTTPFPDKQLCKSLKIEPQLNQDEIIRIMQYAHHGRYTRLVLSLLSPDHAWAEHMIFHEDHIFPQSKFTQSALKKLGYNEAKVESYMSKYNLLPNLQLLTASENGSKSDESFDKWIKDHNDVRSRNLIPDTGDYKLESFEQFFEARKQLIINSLNKLQ